MPAGLTEAGVEELARFAVRDPSLVRALASWHRTVGQLLVFLGAPSALATQCGLTACLLDGLALAACPTWRVRTPDGTVAVVVEPGASDTTHGFVRRRAGCFISGRLVWSDGDTPAAARDALLMQVTEIHRGARLLAPGEVG